MSSVLPEHPQVQKCVILSDAIHLDNPVGFLIFYHKNSEFDYTIKYDERSARDFASEQAEYAWQDMEEGTEMPEWPIYALWAADWPKEGYPKARQERPVETGDVSPEAQEAANTQRAWEIMSRIPKKDLVWLLSQVGLVTDIPDLSLTRAAVSKWYGGFPPNIKELDRMEGKK